MQSFIKDLFSIGLSKFFIILFGLAQSVVTARWLGPEGNGIIAAITVYPSLFLTFGSLGLSQSATHYIGNGKFSESSIKSSIAQIWIFSSLISFVCSYILIRYSSNSSSNILWVFLAVFPVPFALFNTYSAGIFLGKNQIGIYNKINWLPSAVTFIFVTLFIIVFKLSITGALLAILSGPVFMFVLLLARNNFFKAFHKNFNWKITKAMLSLGIVYAISLLIINLNYKINIILLDKLSTAVEIGIYSKGASITEYLWQIPMLLSTIVFARSASAKDGLQFSRKVALLLRLSFVFIGIGSLILIFFSRYIILILFGNEFINSTSVLQFLLPGVLLLTIFKVLNMDLAGKGKPWISMKAMVPSLILNIVLNIFLIPEYGATGAAITSTLSYSFAALLFLHFYSKEVDLPVKEILGFSKSDFLPVKYSFAKIIKLPRTNEVFRKF